MKLTYLCPTLEKCDWQGSEHQLWKHLQQIHPRLVLSRNELYIGTQSSGTDENNFFKHTDGNIVLVQVVRDFSEEVCVVARLLGSPTDAKRYNYSVVVACNDLSLQNENGECNPVRNEGNGVKIDLKMLKMIWKCHGFLKCTIIVNESAPKSDKVIKRHDSFILKQVCPHDTFFRENLNASLEKPNEEASVADIGLERFLCTNCGRYLTSGPVFKCPTNHSICYWCRNSDKPCVTCGNQVTCSRDTSLELERNMQRFPCKFNSKGCNYQNLPEMLLEHESQCKHCFYWCPQCRYKGSYANFEKHFRIAHPSVKQFRVLANHKFSPQTTLLMVHKYGIYMGTCLLHDDIVEWKVVNCFQSEPAPFFQCYILLARKTHPQTSKTLFLDLDDSGPSYVYKLTIHVSNLKPYKPKHASLVCNFQCDQEIR